MSAMNGFEPWSPADESPMEGVGVCVAVGFGIGAAVYIIAMLLGIS